MRSGIVLVAVLGFVESVPMYGEDAKTIDVRTAAGTAVIASQQWIDATILIIHVQSGSLDVQTKDVEKLKIPSSYLFFVEATADSKPLKFLSKSSLEVGQKVKVAETANNKWLVMKPKPVVKEQPPAKPVLPTKTPAELAAEAEKQIPIPTEDQVRDVLKLDTKAKRTEFDLLTTVEKRHALIIAGSIAGLEGVRSAENYGKLDVLILHFDLFDRTKTNEWLVKRAEKRDVVAFLQNMKIPREKEHQVKVQYALVDYSDLNLVKNIARMVSGSGLGSLPDGYKTYVRQHPVLFGIE